jgi:O-succinylhomoserine sulfhydrylase
VTEGRAADSRDAERPSAPRPGTLRPDTLAVRGGLNRSSFDETSEGLFLTQGYVYPRAADAEAAFAGELNRFVYSRYGNPTVGMFEERLRLLEGAEACFATATGMSAVFTSLAALVKSGDRIVAARALFGSSLVIFDELFAKWGVRTDYVDGHVLEQWETALATPATVVFFETPSNPMQDIVDVRAVSELAHRAGALVVLDNVFATPVLQRPRELGADVVVYSATKHIDGEGRVLGGAILGSTDYIAGPDAARPGRCRRRRAEGTGCAGVVPAEGRRAPRTPGRRGGHRHWPGPGRRRGDPRGTAS